MTDELTPAEHAKLTLLGFRTYQSVSIKPGRWMVVRMRKDSDTALLAYYSQSVDSSWFRTEREAYEHFMEFRRSRSTTPGGNSWHT